jgi:myb proto-oncogene protein
LVRKFGKNRALISKNMPSRSGKQIRDRYLNTLDPNTRKENFSNEEDLKLLELFSKYGPAW